MPVRYSVLIIAAALLTAAGCDGDSSGRGAGDTAQIAAAIDGAHAQADTYGSIASRCTADYRTAVESLYDAVLQLQADSTDASLDAAKQAWRKAYDAYLTTEVFYLDPDSAAAQVREHTDARPIIPVEIDYVAGQPMAGLINDKTQTLARPDLLKQQRESGAVRLGYHAVEFVLWGEDNQLDAPGGRPAGDFRAGHPRRERRRTYLLMLVRQLLDDAIIMAGAWQAGMAGNHHARLTNLPPREVLERITAQLQRTIDTRAVAPIDAMLSSPDPQREMSTFSDTTHRDIQVIIAAIAMVYRGNYGIDQNMRPYDEPGLDDLLARIDPDLKQRIDSLLATLTSDSDLLVGPLDAALAGDGDHPMRRRLSRMGDDLKALDALLGELAATLKPQSGDGQ